MGTVLYSSSSCIVEARNDMIAPGFCSLLDKEPVCMVLRLPDDKFSLELDVHYILYLPFDLINDNVGSTLPHVIDRLTHRCQRREGKLCNRQVIITND